MKRAIKLCVALFLPCVLSGCMWGRMQVNDPDIVLRARAIRVGETTADQLPVLLRAEPTMRLPGKDRQILGYTFSDTKSNGLVLILLNFSKTQTVAETLYVEVDSATQVVRKVHVPSRPDIKWDWYPFGKD